MEKRIVTKKVLYGVLADYFKGVDVQLIGGKTKENEDIILHSQDIIDMLNMEIELLTKKATSSNTTKKTKKDEETEKLIEILKSELSKMNEPVTISELIASSEILKNLIISSTGLPISSQKVNAVFRVMLNRNIIYNRIIKGKSYYGIVGEW